MLERSDVEQFTADKQELQLVVELLFEEMMEADFNLQEFLANPRMYTRAFLAQLSGDALRAVLPDAYKLGKSIAQKAGES